MQLKANHELRNSQLNWGLIILCKKKLQRTSEICRLLQELQNNIGTELEIANGSETGFSMNMPRISRK